MIFLKRFLQEINRKNTKAHTSCNRLERQFYDFVVRLIYSSTGWTRASTKLIVYKKNYLVFDGQLDDRNLLALSCLVFYVELSEWSEVKVHCLTIS